MAKTTELRDMSDEQLGLTLKEATENLFRLRIRSQTERLDAPGRPAAARDVRNAGEDDVEVFAGSDLDLDGVRDFEDDDIDDDTTERRSA